MISDGNRLSSIDGSIFKPLESLTELRLFLNQLEKLDDDTFVHLSRLQVLRLWSNRISLIGRNFLNNFQSLKELELRDNLCVDRDFRNVMENIDFVREQLEPCFPELKN